MRRQVGRRTKVKEVFLPFLLGDPLFVPLDLGFLFLFNKELVAYFSFMRLLLQTLKYSGYKKTSFVSKILIKEQ